MFHDQPERAAGPHHRLAELIGDKAHDDRRRPVLAKRRNHHLGRRIGLSGDDGHRARLGGGPAGRGEVATQDDDGSSRRHGINCPPFTSMTCPVM